MPRKRPKVLIDAIRARMPKYKEGATKEQLCARFDAYVGDGHPDFYLDATLLELLRSGELAVTDGLFWWRKKTHARK